MAMTLISSTVSFEERFSLIFNDVMKDITVARNNCLDSKNYTRAAERQAQIDVLEELADKLVSRGMVVLEAVNMEE